VELSYEVVVVGGGHAGCEAAAAAARLGARSLLVTPDLGRIGEMSCNPAIGGVAKGTVVREIDALGGVMGRAADASRIHFRMLNRSKGPAVWGPRAQCDRRRYPVEVRRALEELPGLDLYQDLVTGLVTDGDRVRGIRTRGGVIVGAGAVVVTAGTFLRGRIYTGGGAGVSGGRAGEPPSRELARELEDRGLEIARFKTGTPPRVDGRTVDRSRLREQPGERSAYRFSLHGERPFLEQRSCWITWTDGELARVVRRNLERSALHGGRIQGPGPRYCPSIEDKVVRFPDAPRHKVFLEPEGLDTTEMYLNGLSTSLPPEVQEELVRTVPGLERAKLTRVGYAIEYDIFPPHQLRPTLEVRGLEGLYFAGQINGTTGYEEAAGQGVVAGVNAGLAVAGRGSWVPGRDEAYLGVMVDDLVTRGVEEPYRLFTSRAEFRLLLRQDNAPARLGPVARELGLLTPGQGAALRRRLRREEEIRRWFVETTLAPGVANPVLREAGSSPVEEGVRAVALVRRPEVSARDLARAAGAGFGRETDPEADPGDVLAAVEVEIKYEGYVAMERERAERLRERERMALPEDLPWEELATLSAEGREKLARVAPSTLGQAGRVPGVSAADLQNLVLEVRRWRRVRGGG
jgi:tRNA uridine 5-carboxymethylaminomethyl modification enzyme